MKRILLGTYTKRKSEGIYQIDLNEEQGVLENLTLVAATQNPTYLDYEDGKIYSVIQKDSQGGIAVWDYDGDQAQLAYAVMQDGPQPCYVSYDRRNGMIYEANYHRGRVAMIQDEKIVEEIFYPEGAHAHYIDTDPKTGDVFVTDLGNNRIYKYHEGKQVADFILAKDCGPRHIAFHPRYPLVYVFGEHNSNVTVLEDNGDHLLHKQTVSSLPRKNEIESAGAAVRISKDGNNLYVSNRGHNSISVFAIDGEGMLQCIQNIATEGDHPRDFAFDEKDQYCVVANMASDSLTLYKRHKGNGTLQLLQKDVAAPEVVAVKFI